VIRQTLSLQREKQEENSFGLNHATFLREPMPSNTTTPSATISATMIAIAISRPTFLVGKTEVSGIETTCGTVEVVLEKTVVTEV